MKKLLFITIIVIVIITISIKVNYKAHITLVFGNNMSGNYIYKYQDTRISDIVSDITDNIKIHDRYIQNLLVKADAIYIDLNDLDINKNNVKSLNDLLNIIRIYTKEKVIIILREEKNNTDTIINRWISQISDKYDIIIKR